MEFLPEGGLKKSLLPESQRLVAGLAVVAAGVVEGRSPGLDPAQRERSGWGKEVQKEKKCYQCLKDDSVLIRAELSFRPHTKLSSSFRPGISLAFFFLSLNTLSFFQHSIPFLHSTNRSQSLNFIFFFCFISFSYLQNFSSNFHICNILKEPSGGKPQFSIQYLVHFTLSGPYFFFFHHA